MGKEQTGVGCLFWRGKKSKPNGIIGKLMGACQNSLAWTDTAQRVTITPFLSIPHPQIASVFKETWGFSKHQQRETPGGMKDRPNLSTILLSRHRSSVFPFCYLLSPTFYPFSCHYSTPLHSLSPSSLLDFSTFLLIFLLLFLGKLNRTCNPFSSSHLP